MFSIADRGVHLFRVCMQTWEKDLVEFHLMLRYDLNYSLFIL